MFDTAFSCSHPWGIGLSGDQMTVGLPALGGEPALALLLGAINTHLRRNTVPLEHERKRLMGLSLGLHRIKARPTILGTVDLGTLVAALGLDARKHCVRKHVVGQAVIPQHAVISRESP